MIQISGCGSGTRRSDLVWPLRFLIPVVIAACGCAPALDTTVDIPGYPTCSPGAGGDLGTSLPAELTVTINPGDTRQEMLGFGASDCWSIQFVGRWPLEKRKAIADLLFETGLDENNDPRGVGLSVWRFNIGAGSSRQEHISREWRRADTFLNEELSGFDWDRQPGQRWFLQAAAARGVPRFIAFVNSPPITMTANGRAFCDTDTSSSNLAPGKEGEFAAYLANVVRHLRENEGIEFDVISPFNEPQWDWEAGTQEGCRFSPSDMKRVVDALAREDGLAGAEIEIPESGSILDLGRGANYLQAFFDPDSPTFSGDVVAPRIAGHSYKTDLPETGLVGRRVELRAALDRYPGLQYAMTEFCVLGEHGSGRDLGIDTALHVARVMHFDLVVAGASTWQWWLAVSPYDYKDGLIYIDKETDDGEFYESKTLWAMGNFSRFVRPGMVRLEVQRSDDKTHQESAEGLMVSSFLDHDSGIVATVFVNWVETGVPVELEVNGFEAVDWIPYVTTNDLELAAQRSVTAGNTILIPARSVVTLVGRVNPAEERSAKGD